MARAIINAMLILAFFLSASVLFCQSVFGWEGTLLPFSPWIAYVSLKCSLPKALWLSAAAGLLLDLFSDHPIGVHAVNYTLSAALLYRLSKHLLADTFLHLSLYTSLISFVSTVLHLFLLFLFDRRVPFTGKWAIGDLIGMPLLDGVSAFLWFALPLSLASYLRRYWMVFWLKRKNPSPT